MKYSVNRQHATWLQILLVVGLYTEFCTLYSVHYLLGNGGFCFVQSSIEHRKLAVDLVDVIIKWEIERIKEGTETEVHDVSFDLFP